MSALGSPKECAVCEERFVLDSPGRKYCSDGCVVESKRRAAKRRYRELVESDPGYRSRENVRQRRGRLAKPLRSYVCADCGAEVVHPHRQSPLPKRCKGCRLELVRASYTPVSPGGYDLVCGVCESSFTHRVGHAKFCSSTCRNKAKKLREDYRLPLETYRA